MYRVCGEPGAQVGFPGGAGQPDQQWAGDAGGGREPGVAGQFAGHPGQRFAAGVVLDVEVQPPGRGLPGAVAVGACVLPPDGGGALLGPPDGQPAAGGQRPGGVDPGDEQAVGTDEVGEAGGVGEGEQPVVAVAQFPDADPASGGEDLRAGRAEGVVVGDHPGPVERPCPVECAQLVQGGQADLGGALPVETQPGDLGAGEDLMFGEHVQQPPVAGGEPAGQLPQCRLRPAASQTPWAPPGRAGAHR